MQQPKHALIEPGAKRVSRVWVVGSAQLACDLMRMNGETVGLDPSEWVETFDDSPTERYAGVGDIYDPQKREKFEDGPGRRSPTPGAGDVKT